MKTSVNINFLRIPMSILYDLDDVESFGGLSDEQFALLSEEYDDEELDGIYAALAFASENPDYDFKALLPDVTQSNAEIAVVLQRIYLSMSA